MKNFPVFFFIFFFIFALSFAAFAAISNASEPIVSAHAQKINAPPDPYEQLLAAREADNSQTAVNWVVFVLGVVLVGIGWFALSERTTKAIRAANNLRKPVRRVRMVPQAQQATLPQAQGIPQG